MNLNHAEVFTALAVAGVAGLWRAATLRGDARKEWSPRVEDAEIGLRDRAIRELLAMQDEIASLIGSGASSLPRLATFDPTPLSKRASAFQKTLAVGFRLADDFRWLLMIGPLLIAATAAFLVGLAAVFVDNSNLVHSSLLRIGGLSVGGLGLVLGFALLVAYIVINQRLSGAELRALEDVE